MTVDRPPMRVLFINRMASLERGGGETFDLEISRHLERLGCTVTYLSGLPLFSGARTPLSHPRSNTLRTPYFGWVPWDVMKGGWRLRVADVALFEQAAVRWAAARKETFDVVQVCELPGFVRGWKQAGHRTPVVIRLTAPNYYDPANAIPRADAVIASGTSLETLRAGPFPRIVDIPNAVDPEQFRPHASGYRQAAGVPDDAFVLLYVARFQAFKNHALLIEAFARVARACPPAVLLLAGSGPLRDRVAQQVRDLGLTERVRFLGEVPFAAVPDLYAASDLKVISSDYESFCFAAIEAMASGLPVVTTDGGWVPRLLGERVDAAAPVQGSIQQQGGMVSPVGDAGRFADSTLCLWRNEGLRREMAAFNRAKAVREHGWEKSAGKLRALYEAVVAQSGS